MIFRPHNASSTRRVVPPASLAFSSIDSYGSFSLRFRLPAWIVPAANINGSGRKHMRRALLIVGFLALAIGLLWIGQGTGVVAWPKTSFMINEIQWAGYGAAVCAIGLILIWQSQR
jgi:hypothetical protein